jgi:class 3 adenylate cyclase
MSGATKQAISPEMAIRAVETSAAIDVSGILAEVRTPTLVVEFAGSRAGSRARDVASIIPDARLLSFAGDITAMWEADYTTAVMAFLNEDDTNPTVAPSGTAIVFFADIVDSTVLTERLGDAAFREKARDLDSALRAIIRDNGGTPIEGKLLGDGVLATFSSASQAIAAALACGQAGEDGGLPLHLGLHAGDVIREDNNVFGGAVNVAARISGLSAAGEVLVSDTVRSLARTSAGVSFEDRGEQKLKGVGEAVRVWAVGEES